jgi:hypothetical protein
MTNVSAQRLIQSAREAAMRIASGPFTPVVFERYEWVTGERGTLIGHATQTEDGRPCIAWRRTPDLPT